MATVAPRPIFTPCRPAAICCTRSARCAQVDACQMPRALRRRIVFAAADAARCATRAGRLSAVLVWLMLRSGALCPLASVPQPLLFPAPHAARAGFLLAEVKFAD